MALYPLRLSYITKSMIWGGRKLIDPAYGWNRKSDFQTVGEAWTLTCRPNEMSVILNGACHGMSLSEYFDLYGRGVIGDAFKGNTFPLLIKLIDATDKLSVQVHPDDAYAARMENGSGKTEMWYIVDAEPGSEIVYGLEPGITKERFNQAVLEREFDGILHRQPVKAGETYFIPSGMVHAIGAGILIAEIQQNCDLTYRVYDYDRLQADGTKRQLHPMKAMEVTKPFTEEDIRALRFEAATEEELSDPTVLAHCKYFKTRHYTVDRHLDLTPPASSFLSLQCIGGDGFIRHGLFNYPFAKGDNYFIPAGTTPFCMEGTLDVLETSLS